MLGRSSQSDVDGILVAGDSRQVGLRFAVGADHGEDKNWLHLHLTEHIRKQRDTISACVAHGGRLLGNGHVQENSYAVMADVVGDEFCVIEDGNSYLAECGPLGEVTCEGTRAVGLFWGAALGWPLVWEEGEETAIQSPLGGTKIAWSGEPVNPNAANDRQFFVLTVASDELEDEVSRLMTSGASGRATGPSGDTTLVDPDGNTFVVRAV